MQRTCLAAVLSALPFQHLYRSLLKEYCRDSGFPGCITGSAAYLCFCFSKPTYRILRKVLKALTISGWNFQVEKKNGQILVQVPGDMEFNLEQLIRHIMCLLCWFFQSILVLFYISDLVPLKPFLPF